MTDFHRLCAAADIPNGGHKAFDVKGEAILVININHGFHAVRNRCTHLDFPLEGGRQMGFEIMCRQHGARFDIRTGKALGGPAVERLRVFETRITEGFVEVAVAHRPI